VIVASILLAFGIDAWWDGLQRSSDERASLTLLSRDLNDAIEQLESFVVWSSESSRAALRAYAALATPGPHDREAVHRDLLKIDRRTLRLPTAAYTDLLSSGNLRVIRSRDLRDAIIRFYEAAERSQSVIDKNNATYIDGLALDSFYRDGLLLSHFDGDMGSPVINAAHDSVRSRLGPDFVHAPDPLWRYGPESREWQQLRSRLLVVGRAHPVGEVLAAEMIVQARALDELIRQHLTIE
jgi:hypothetical protein